jgi:hypothetical protein
MSLTVPPELVSQAEKGAVSDEDFVRCIRDSLPYAYEMVEGLAARLSTGDLDADQVFADNRTEPPTEQDRGQLLRAMASDAIRGALERHFSVRLAFQNCHRVAVFPAGAEADEAHARFTSVRAQLLNQSPELVNC